MQTLAIVTAAGLALLCAAHRTGRLNRWLEAAYDRCEVSLARLKRRKP